MRRGGGDAVVPCRPAPGDVLFMFRAVAIWPSADLETWAGTRMGTENTGDLVPTPPQSALAPRASAALAVRELTRTMSGTFSSSTAPPSASYRSRTPSLWGWHTCVCVCVCVQHQ